MPQTVMPQTLSAEMAAGFARLALGHVTREYPNYLTHGMSGPADTGTPRELHPVFYGSYDWHSCVHGYWMLARLLRLFPGMPPAADIRALFDAEITAEKVAGECAYLQRPMAKGFERPYGWAWALKLSEAMMQLPEPRWAATLAPLTGIFAHRFRDFLPLATYPVRVGTHFNSAFALALTADYAEAVADAPLTALLRDTAESWYGTDTGCQAWEPSGDDFLSPALIEAKCMLRLLPPEHFSTWFDRFLPDLADRQPLSLFTPALVSDRSDGKIAHLDGLNLSRSWCWRSLARALPIGDRRRPVLEQAADTHLAAGLPHLASDYMGEHWLATFAVLALE
jgi:hypothetical protein